MSDDLEYDPTHGLKKVKESEYVRFCKYCQKRGEPAGLLEGEIGITHLDGVGHVTAHYHRFAKDVR